MFLTLLSVGGAIGSAISGAIWGRVLPAKLRLHLPDGAKDQAMVIYGDINEALKYPVGSPERDAINLSYQETMTKLLTAAVCVCALVILCSLPMHNYDLSNIQQGVKGRVVGGEVDRNEQKMGDRRSYARRMIHWLRDGQP